jgi:large subunit ribosomal protein L49
MSQLFTRATSALRCSAGRHTLLSRPSPLPIVQTASLSFQPTRSVLQYRPRANPSEDRKPKAHVPVPQPTKTAEELAQLAYVVRRTPSAQLPLYRRWMSGGTRLVILIKKVDGDRRKMVDDLIEALQITREDVRLNPTTQHIELKVIVDSTRWRLAVN